MIFVCSTIVSLKRITVDGRASCLHVHVTCVNKDFVTVVKTHMRCIVVHSIIAQVTEPFQRLPACLETLHSCFLGAGGLHPRVLW